MLQVVLRVVYAGLIEPVLRKSPQTLDRVVVTTVGSIEYELHVAFTSLFYNIVCAMYPKIINKHVALSSLHCLSQLSNKDDELIAVDRLLVHVQRDDLTTAIHGSNHSDSLEAYFLLLYE